MPPDHTLLGLEEVARWDSALAGIPHGFAHTHGYCEALSRGQGPPLQLYVYQMGAERFVFPMAEREMHGEVDIVTPGGFSGIVGRGDVGRFLAHFSSFAQEKGWVCGYIGLHPIFSPKAFGERPEYAAHNEIYVLDLRRPLAELVQRLSTNRKRQLRRFAEERHAIVRDNPLTREFLVAHLDHFLRNRGANAASRLSDEAIRALAGCERTLSLAVMRDGEVEAAVLFGYSDHCADYLLGASLGEGKRHSAALIWHGTVALRELGVPMLNLGGGVRRRDGVAEFKMRFGPQPMELGALRQIYRPQAYARLCRLVHADAGESAFFPAYRAPRGVDDLQQIGSSDVH